MHPLETYLRELAMTRYSGAATDELSHYSALKELFDEVGEGLRPKVQCIMNLKNQGAGYPDGGLFTTDQLRDDPGDNPMFTLIPARGVIEVKGADDDALETVYSDQVDRYLKRYGLVLVTNLRDFVLVTRDENGEPEVLESYRLAESENEFWSGVRSRRDMVREHGDRLLEYLKRVMLHAARLSDPRDVAWFLASYARDARLRIDGVELEALDSVRSALEEALGLAFEGEQGDHFFRSTLIQTLFYGVFSAWVLWSKEHLPASKQKFDWRMAEWSLRVPMIRALFEQVATPSRIRRLDLVEVLNWAEAALNRIDRSTFFERFEEEHAVQYFYEPFLEAFDPELRRQLGVWYTPPEVVQYMVARVDTVLREELELPDGLADPNVYVLDPATGTGSYLVEVLNRIDRTLRERGEDALSAHEVKQAAMERVFGFEIMPAPFVVAHLQLGLLLQNLGAPLADDGSERAGVYLTNALTDWEPPEEPQQRLIFPELEEERDAAEHVKRDTPILVVLGNPPYNGYAGVAMDEERDLSNAYRKSQRARQPQGQGLNDLYVRFFRMAERRIVEQSGKGVVCLISNYSWLDGLSHPAMRERYLDVFDTIWIDNLNGDKYKTGKLTPEGDPDPSIFSTGWNREGIQVGTAISLLVRGQPHTPVETVQFRNIWGRSKWGDLLATAEQDGSSLYQQVQPPDELGLPYTPLVSDETYFTWPLLPDLFPVSFPGVKTSRDDVVVDIDRDRLVHRMKQYFDPSISHEEMRRIAPGAMEDAAGFKAKHVRSYLRERGLLPDNIVRHLYRPFDVRWLYWEPETNLLDRNRPDYHPHVTAENIWIGAARQNRKEFNPPLTTARHGSLHVIERGVSFFPLYLQPSQSDNRSSGMEDMFTDHFSGTVTFNLSEGANLYLTYVAKSDGIEKLFYSSVAIMHSVAYRVDNSGALRQDWPRIPLPDSADRLKTSAELGRQIAALLDPEQPVEGVTTGAIRPELRAIVVITRVGGGSLNPSAGELAINAGWGYAGRGGITMPGKGRAVEREYEPEERAAIERGAAGLGLSAEQTFAHLGETTYDVYLSDVACWRNVPAGVWDYTIGGYQVMKKWLSYREEKLLGRPLRSEEAREVADMAHRIAAILFLEPDLDANYRAVKASTYPWPGSGE